MLEEKADRKGCSLPVGDAWRRDTLERHPLPITEGWCNQCQEGFHRRAFFEGAFVEAEGDFVERRPRKGDLGIGLQCSRAGITRSGPSSTFHRKRANEDPSPRHLVGFLWLLLRVCGFTDTLLRAG